MAVRPLCPYHPAYRLPGCLGLALRLGSVRGSGGRVPNRETRDTSGPCEDHSQGPATSQGDRHAGAPVVLRSGPKRVRDAPYSADCPMRDHPMWPRFWARGGGERDGEQGGRARLRTVLRAALHAPRVKSGHRRKGQGFAWLGSRARCAARGGAISGQERHCGAAVSVARRPTVRGPVHARAPAAARARCARPGPSRAARRVRRRPPQVSGERAPIPVGTTPDERMVGARHAVQRSGLRASRHATMVAPNHLYSTRGTL